MKRPRILIIDDEVGPRESLKMILKDNYDLLLASSGTEGLDIFLTQDIDLVITDIKMPDLSGIEVLQKIREKNKELPVIMITGYASEEANSTAKEFGISGYIKKPYDVTYIREEVERVLKDTLGKGYYL